MMRNFGCHTVVIATRYNKIAIIGVLEVFIFAFTVLFTVLFSRQSGGLHGNFPRYPRENPREWNDIAREFRGEGIKLEGNSREGLNN